MDYDALTFNLSSNATQEEREYVDFFVTNVMFIVVTSISALANCMIIYSVARFKNMRTKRNLIIMNWAISDLLYQLSHPSKYESLLVYSNGFYHRLSFELCYNYLVMTNVFVLMLTLNCLYKRVTLNSFKKICLVLWPCSVLLFLLMVALWNYFGLGLPYMLFYSLMLFISISACSVKLCMYGWRRIAQKEKHTKLRYILISVFVVSWIPSVAMEFFWTYFVSHYNNTVHIAISCSAIPGVLNAAANIYLLRKYDTNFKICLSHIFKCSSSKYVEETVAYENGDDNNLNVVSYVNA